MGRIIEREFNEWVAFNRIEPIGGERQDFNAAVVASKWSSKPVDPAPFAIKPPPAAGEIGRAFESMQGGK